MSVIIGVDGSDGSDHALAWAIDEARRRSTDLRLIHAWTAPGPHAATPTSFAPLAAAAQELTDVLLASARSAAPDLVVDARCIPRRAANALVADAGAGDLVVVGSQGRGAIGRALIGSVADAVLRLSPVPVAVVRPGALEQPGAPVVVGIDGSPGSIAAFELGTEEAAARGVRVVALHAWRVPFSELGVMSTTTAEDWEADAAAVLDTALASIPDSGAERRIGRGDAGNELLAAASEASVVVVGSRGLGEVGAMLLGSVSRRLVHGATCPVIVVPRRHEG